MITKENSRTFLKAINRYVRRKRVFDGGRTFGVDYATWQVCYPQIAKAYNQAASLFLGRPVTRALPIFS